MFLLDIFNKEKRFSNRVDTLKHLKKLSVKSYKKHLKNNVEFVVSLNELKTIMDFLIISEQKGTTQKTFEKSLKSVGMDLPKKLTETLYRTILLGAGQHCRWQRHEESKEFTEKILYDAVGDTRTRENHGALDGIARKIDDPIWDIFYPPNGINCRCTCISLSKTQLKRTKTKNSDLTNVYPDDGWNFNIGKNLSKFVEVGVIYLIKKDAVFDVC